MHAAPASPPRFNGTVRAKCLVPGVGPATDNAAVVIQDGLILQAGPWKKISLTPPVLDLGEVILLPGLINAHCHLEYTGMAGQISPPKSFSDWIKALLALKAHWTFSDYALSWINGARMLLSHGVTTVANIEATPELLPDVRLGTPLRVCSLLEMTGVRSRRTPSQILDETLARIDSFPPPARWAGLSPHAPYSTSPELLTLSARVARERQLLLATHVAESIEEYRMYRHGDGAMFDWLRGQRNMSDCAALSPIRHLERHGLLGPNLLAIHVNYLDRGDADLLARNQVSVVHCPRSHAYFNHREFSYRALQAAGINVCLGTDSLVSMLVEPGRKLALDLFAEMRLFAKRHRAVAPGEVLALATVNAAKALSQEGNLGVLAPGACADLIAIPFPTGTGDPFKAILHQDGPVLRSMINGAWVYSRSLC